MKSIDITTLLEHLPQLNKTYGKWPSFAYLVVATVMTPAVFLASIILIFARLLK